MKKNIFLGSIAVVISIASANAQVATGTQQRSAQIQQTSVQSQLSSSTQVTPVALPQTAPEMFVAMPDSMMPYLVSSQRKALVEIRKIDSEGSASIPGAFNKEIKITAMSDNLIRIVPSANAVWEIIRYKDDVDSKASAKCKTIFALIRTVQGPAQHSTISVFDNKWKKLRDVGIPTEGLIEKPDTMSQETFDSLRSMIEIPMAYTTVNDDCSMLIVNLSLPLVNKEDSERIKAILVQRKIKLQDIFLK